MFTQTPLPESLLSPVNTGDCMEASLTFIQDINPYTGRLQYFGEQQE